MQFRLLKLGLCNRCNIKFQILAPDLLHVTYFTRERDVRQFSAGKLCVPFVGRTETNHCFLIV